MTTRPSRRDILLAAAAGLGAGLLPRMAAATPPPSGSASGPASTPATPAVALPTAVKRPPISLAQWSLHRSFAAGTIDALDFPLIARRDYGIDAVEYVNSFFVAKVADEAWLSALRRRADDQNVRSLLIMCDGLGALGDPDPAKRRAAVQRHGAWLDAAKRLGCHSIRVNAQSEGSWDEQRDRAADGLHQLCVLAAERGGDERGLNVIVENHGGLSSNGRWLAETIKAADHPRCGTLPDFGNFDLGGGGKYDRYVGVAELMPFAKGVSAKSHDFNEAGDETATDYRKMLAIVLDAGYRDHIGIEYEGSRLSEPDGIRATKRLLVRVLDELLPSTKSAAS